MNREDVLKIVRESYEQGQADIIESCKEAVVIAIEVAIADEREACAKVCYAVMKEYDPFSNQANAARNCAADIRARENK